MSGRVGVSVCSVLGAPTAAPIVRKLDRHTVLVEKIAAG